MRKLIILILLLVLIPSVCFASTPKRTAPKPKVYYSIYGMTFFYIDNAPIVWAIMRDYNDGNIYEIMAGKPIHLVNRGEVLETHIRIPYTESYVRVYYNEHIYNYKLIPYMLNYNCILFIFRGET